MTTTPNPSDLRIVFTGVCAACNDRCSFEELTDQPLDQGRPIFECGGCGSTGVAVEIATERHDHDIVAVTP